jgi:succinate dehydrogenase hydrophobic anchor subunit
MTAAERASSLGDHQRAPGRLQSVLPSALALAYPGAVWLLFHSAAWARAATGLHLAAAWLGVAAALALSSLPSAAAFLSLRRKSVTPDAPRAIDLLAFGAPALYTLLRVLLAGAQAQLDDILVWGPAWGILGAVAAFGTRPRAAAAPRPLTRTSRLQVAHGAIAAVVLAAFLLLHLGNQLLGLFGVPVHDAAMKALRHWYRSAWVEPLLLALFGLLVASGAGLLGRQRGSDGPGAGEVAGPWRTLQLATGAGLVPFLLAHVTVVLGARALSHANTDWTFATGGPEGLLGSFANARLIPYYWFAVFAVVAHLGTGLRTVLLGHDRPRAMVDRLALGVTGSGALLATGIVAAMCGLRLSS